MTEITTELAQRMREAAENNFAPLLSIPNKDILALLDELTKTERLLAQSMKGDRVVSRRKLAQLRSDVLTLEDALARSDSELIAARQRIAELEAQVSNLEISCDRNYVAGLQAGWNFGDAGDNAGLAQCIESRQKYIRESRTAGSVALEARTEQQPVGGNVIGWLRGDYCSDDRCDPKPPLFILGNVEPSDVWGVKYLPLATPAPAPVTVKLPADAEHDVLAPVVAYFLEALNWDGGSIRWDGRKEYDVLADRVRYALEMVFRRAAGIKIAEGE